MADLTVEVVEIDNINPHPNADRMELALVGGYQVCVQLGTYKAGDLAVYVPVDSILPEKLEATIFGPNSKVKLHNHRVKAIKLRGAVSQGMLLPIDMVLDYFIAQRVCAGCNHGDDVTELLGITKYAPPIKAIPQGMQVKGPARHHHPDFHKYTSINHLKKYYEAIPEGTPVWNTEKLHGTNFRAGWLPFVPRTFFQKVKNILGLSQKWEFVYGSHNVQLMDGKGKNAFAGNVYKRIVDKEKLRDIIPKGQVWYGEIIGGSIQTGYSYGYMEHGIAVRWFDIIDEDKYLDFDFTAAIVENLGQVMVPYEYVDCFTHNWMLQLLEAKHLPSEIDNKTQVEGFVIRPLKETSFYGGRLILKALTDTYLLRKDNSDWK
jgi:RNA ligase (TIGR02306 family)